MAAVTSAEAAMASVARPHTHHTLVRNRRAHMAGANRPPAIRIDALDLGLESLTAPRVKLTVEALGQVLQGEELEVAAVSDGEGVLVLNQRFTLELEDGSPLRSELASALRSDDAEASDVHMVVHACAGGVSAGASTELASGCSLAKAT